MKRKSLPMIAVLLIASSAGCCCSRSLFGPSYSQAPPYYPPPTTITPAVQTAPICTPAPVVQQQCPCVCPQ